MGIIGSSDNEWPPRATHRNTQKQVILEPGVELYARILRGDGSLKREVMGTLARRLDDSRSVELSPSFNIHRKRNGDAVIRFIKRGVILSTQDSLVHIELLPDHLRGLEQDGEEE